MSPVEGSTLRSSAAVGIHPVHTVLVDQPDEALGKFLNGFIEGFRRAVSVIAQHFILGFNNSGKDILP